MRTVRDLAVFIMVVGLLTWSINRSGRERQWNRARQATTRPLLKLLHNAVAQFKVDTGRYPTAGEGFNALLAKPADVVGWNRGGYLETADVPKDAWGREFIYIVEPAEGVPFAIVSYGADGKPGGEGYDADLTSRHPDL